METSDPGTNRSHEYTKTEMIHTNNTSSQTRDIVMSVTKALGVLTGLLTAALVVVTMGWIVSCVYWQRRHKQR